MKVIMSIAIFACFSISSIHANGNKDFVESNELKTILFVGNSFVLTENIPRQVQILSEMYDMEISYKDISKGGATLRNLRSDAVREIQRNKYKYVVLQDQSRRPINHYEDFKSDIKFLCEEAKKNGIIPVLYNPAWPNINGQPDRELQSVLTELYKKAAYENDAILVNAGDAWVYAYEKFPNLSLYAEDMFHANIAGAYYTACVFAATLFNIHVEVIDQNSPYKSDDALILSNAAWEFVRLSP